MTSAAIPADEPQSLYRFYDASGQLLYIGITVDVTIRWSSHTRGKVWWKDVVHATVEHHPNRTAVLAAEAAAIKAEKPLHNITHNRSRRRPTVPPDHNGFGFPIPPGLPKWTFASLRSGKEKTAPLWLYWELDGDPMSDDYTTDEVDAIELWNMWRRNYPKFASTDGPKIAKIWWFVMGPGVVEIAPLADPYGEDPWLHRKNFLTGYTWPYNPTTERPLRWTELHIADKVWRTGTLPPGVVTKGGFIQEVTGWKPSPYQPFVDIAHLEQLARL